MLEIDIEKRIVNGVWEGYIGRVNRQSIRVFTGKRMSGVELTNFFASGSLDNTKLKVYGPDGPIYLTYESIDISSPGSVAAYSPRVFVEERTLERFIDNFDQYVEGSSGVAKAAAQEALDAKDQLTTDVSQALSTLNEDKQMAINELNQVKESNRKRYLDPVATVAERDSAYPTPGNGDSVWVSGEGKMYRYNGTEWKVTNENDPSAIDMVNQQLADKPDKTYVDLKTQAANLAWKESYATLEALQTAYPTGDEFNHVVLNDGMIYTWVEGAWSNTQVQANGTGIADRTVTAEKTTFANPVNIAGDYVDRLHLSGGALTAVFGEANGYGSYVTKVEKGRTYTISKGASNRFRVATSIGYPIRGQSPNRYLSLADALDEYTLTMQGEEDHITVYVTSEGLPPSWFQLEEGNEKTEYAQRGEKAVINFRENSIDFTSLKGIRPFGYVIGLASQFKVDMLNKKIITGTNGTPVVLVGSHSYPLKAGEWDFSSWAGTNKVVIGFNTSTRDVVLLETESLANKIHNHIVVIGGMHIAAGNYFVNGLHYRDGEVSPTPTPSTRSEGIFIADNAGGNYYYESANWYIEPLANRDINLVYGIYDDLVSQYPEYVSKTHLGDDEGGVPLFRYDFKPIEIHKESNSHPKIIYTCTHGHEASATYGGALFFRDLCENWKSAPIKRLLRWNIHFIVIPNLNPWGFNNGSRPNFNGVDLARNFSAGWEFNDTEEYRFSGNEPLSEFGTQTMDQLLNQNKDALFVLDHHNYGGDPADGSTLLWTGALDEDIQVVERKFIHNIVVHMKERFPDDISEGVKLGTTADAVRGGSLTSQVHSHGIRGMILECGHKINKSYEKGQTFNADSVGNAFVSVIKYFSR